MPNNNFAVLDDESFSLIKSLLNDANIKTLTKEETEKAHFDESFNPFDHPDYWVMVSRVNLRENIFKMKGKYEDKFAYQKLVTLQEFERFDFTKSYVEFVNSFLDWSSSHSHIVLGKLKLETWNQFVSRCKVKYKSDHIYSIMPRISNASHGSNSVHGQESFIQLRDLVIKFCYQLEKNNHSNYLLGPELSRLNEGISNLQDAAHSWGKSYYTPT